MSSIPSLPFSLPPPEEPKPVSSPSSTTNIPKKCANCHKEGAQLRCSVCRKVVYCNGACQKSDWKFHKRICEKPKPVADDSSSSISKPPTSSSTPVNETKPTSSSEKSNVDIIGDDDLDEEERAAIEEVRKRGYRYFARKLDESETAAIGDIRPKAISEVEKVAETSEVNASSGSASDWNKSGTTFEQRNFGSFVKSRICEFLSDAKRRGALLTPVASEFAAPIYISNWGDSTCDVIITRGKSKYLYDINFRIYFAVVESDHPEFIAVKTDAVDDTEKFKDLKKFYLEFSDVSAETETGDRHLSLNWGSPSPTNATRDAIESIFGVSLKTGPVAVVRDILERAIMEFKSK